MPSLLNTSRRASFVAPSGWTVAISQVPVNVSSAFATAAFLTSAFGSSATATPATANHTMPRMNRFIVHSSVG